MYSHDIKHKIALPEGIDPNTKEAYGCWIIIANIELTRVQVKLKEFVG